MMDDIRRFGPADIRHQTSRSVPIAVEYDRHAQRGGAEFRPRSVEFLDCVRGLLPGFRIRMAFGDLTQCSGDVAHQLGTFGVGGTTCLQVTSGLLSGYRLTFAKVFPGLGTELFRT